MINCVSLVNLLLLKLLSVFFNTKVMVMKLNNNILRSLIIDDIK
jgi:hypothetical protein